MSQRIDTKTQYIKKLNTLKSSLNQLVIDSLFFFNFLDRQFWGSSSQMYINRYAQTESWYARTRGIQVTLHESFTLRIMASKERKKDVGKYNA